jgi:flagellar basal body-associated protein FliL
MKRIIVIILVIILVAGGGAGGLMMMGVIPNPLNPTPQGPALTGAEKAAAELAAKKFQPPVAALDLVKLDDMIIPVIIDGQVNRRVFIIARLVVNQAANVTAVEEKLRVYQDQVLRDLVPFFQKYFVDHDTVSADVVKVRLIAAAKKVYGETVPDVLLINVFDQTNGKARR